MGPKLIIKVGEFDTILRVTKKRPLQFVLFSEEFIIIKDFETLWGGKIRKLQQFHSI